MPSTPDTKPQSAWSIICDQVAPVPGEESWGGPSCGITRGPPGSQTVEGHVDTTRGISRPSRRSVSEQS